MGMKLSHLLAALALVGGPRGSAAPDRIDRYVRAFLQRHRIPSASIAIVRNEQAVKVAAYGRANLELHVPADPRTVYEVGSPGQPRTTPSFGFNGVADRFAFLGREDHGAGGVERFGIRVRWIYRYKLVSGSRVIYYTFELAPDGKVARFGPAED